MKLSESAENKEYVIIEIVGDEHLENRLSAMGIRKGVSIKVLKNKKKMPLLIYARDTMIAVGRVESEKIMIGGIMNEMRSGKMLFMQQMQ